MVVARKVDPDSIASKRTIDFIDLSQESAWRQKRES